MKKLLSSINFTGFYLVMLALICREQVNVLFSNTEGGWNAVGAFFSSIFGDTFYFGFMFIPIIIIVLHKLTGLLEYAQGLSLKLSKIFGLMSSVALCVLQVYMRLEFGNASFITYYYQYRDYAQLASSATFHLTSNLSLLFIGLLGYSVYSVFLDSASYRYVEVTTTSSDSIYYEETTSDEKHAVWLQIVLGIATTLLPIVVSNTPLIFLVVLFFIFSFFRQKSRESFLKNCIIVELCGLAVLLPVFYFVLVPII